MSRAVWAAAAQDAAVRLASDDGILELVLVLPDGPTPRHPISWTDLQALRRGTEMPIPTGQER